MENIFYLLQKNSLIAGFDNSSFLLILLIFSFFIYIIYKIILELIRHRNLYNSLLRNIDDLPNGNIENDLNMENVCAICHENLNNTAELDCNHKFCAKCIMDYYSTTQPKLKCPICRKNIRLINILNFDRSEEIRQYMEMIVIFNHDHLNGYNYVFNIHYFYSKKVFIFLFKY